MIKLFSSKYNGVAGASPPPSAVPRALRSGASLPALRPPCGFAERGRASPPSLHFVAPLSLPPSPLRGYPPLCGAISLASLPHRPSAQLRCLRQRGVAAKRRGRRGLRPPLPGDPPPSPSGGAIAPRWRGAPQQALRAGALPPRKAGAPRFAESHCVYNVKCDVSI